ncbi:MAG: hypothetical protein ACTSRI_10740 [Promethearchaeota archaeon]
MHFIKKVIETPILEDPAKNHKDIHRHFNRYSRGDFIGPSIKITKTKNKLTLKGSHEYEDLILEIVIRTILEKEVDVKGVLISGEDISETITNLGFDWNLTKSKGKTSNYKANIEDVIKKTTLLESIEAFRENSYFLLSFNLNPTCKITTKTRIPQPSKKKVEDDNVDKRIQFCTGCISNTIKNLGLISNLGLSDFKSELPEQWKSIIVLNNYKIMEIELPKNIKNSRLLRIMAIRKGKIIRSVNIDGELIEKQYSIVV